MRAVFQVETLSLSDQAQQFGYCFFLFLLFLLLVLFLLLARLSLPQELLTLFFLQPLASRLLVLAHFFPDPAFLHQQLGDSLTRRS